MPKKRQRVYSPRSRFLGVLCYYVIGVTFNRLGAFFILPHLSSIQFQVPVSADVCSPRSLSLL